MKLNLCRWINSCNKRKGGGGGERKGWNKINKESWPEQEETEKKDEQRSKRWSSGGYNRVLNKNERRQQGRREKKQRKTEETKTEAGGDLNHNRLMNFTRSCLSRGPRGNGPPPEHCLTPLTRLRHYCECKPRNNREERAAKNKPCAALFKAATRMHDGESWSRESFTGCHLSLIPARSEEHSFKWATKCSGSTNQQERMKWISFVYSKCNSRKRQTEHHHSP